jgi:NTP pyrophosphatase (non-canonical NTP hydrolase)
MKTYRTLELAVLRWSEARKIIPNSTPKAQAKKLVEEANETLEAATKLFFMQVLDQNSETVQKTRDELRDGLGDCMVCLINIAALADMDLVECLEYAYNEIKDRKGTMNAEGIFVKET